MGLKPSPRQAPDEFGSGQTPYLFFDDGLIVANGLDRRCVFPNTRLWEKLSEDNSSMAQILMMLNVEFLEVCLGSSDLGMGASEEDYENFLTGNPHYLAQISSKYDHSIHLLIELIIPGTLSRRFYDLIDRDRCYELEQLYREIGTNYYYRSIPYNPLYKNLFDLEGDFIYKLSELRRHGKKFIDYGTPALIKFMDTQRSGDPIEFLKRFYAPLIERGELTFADIREFDNDLYHAIRRVAKEQNKTLPEILPIPIDREESTTHLENASFKNNVVSLTTPHFDLPKWNSKLELSSQFVGRVFKDEIAAGTLTRDMLFALSPKLAEAMRKQIKRHGNMLGIKGYDGREIIDVSRLDARNPGDAAILKLEELKAMNRARVKRHRARAKGIEPK